MGGVFGMAQCVALQLLAENDGAGGEEGDAQRDRDDVADRRALLGQVGKRPDGQNGSRDAAGSEQAGDAPVDRPFLAWTIVPPDLVMAA